MNTTQEARKQKAEEAHELADKVITAFYEKLKAKLTERGHIFEVDEKGRPRKVDKVNLYFSATKERGRGYGQPISGKIRVEFGSYPNSKKFFQSKARGGDFDYEAIADEVKIRIAGAKERAEKLRRERAVEVFGCRQWQAAVAVGGFGSQGGGASRRRKVLVWRSPEIAWIDFVANSRGGSCLSPDPPMRGGLSGRERRQPKRWQSRSQGKTRDAAGNQSRDC